MFFPAGVSWVMFAVACSITGVFGLGVNILVVLNSTERKVLWNMVWKKMNKRSVKA